MVRFINNAVDFLTELLLSQTYQLGQLKFIIEEVECKNICLIQNPKVDEYKLFMSNEINIK